MKTQPPFILKKTTVKTASFFPNPPPGASQGDRFPSTVGKIEGVVNGSDGANYILSFPNGEKGIYGYWEFEVTEKVSLRDKVRGVPSEELVTEPVSNFYPFPLKIGTKRTSQRYDEVRDLFLEDLQDYLGVLSHPKGRLLVETAWRMATQTGDPLIPMMGVILKIGEDLAPLIKLMIPGARV